MECKQCNKEIEKNLEGKFVAFDLQKKSEEEFCSVSCLNSWMKTKIFGMCAMLVLGVIITVGLFPEIGGVAITLLFLPYMIRQVRHSLGSIFNSGSFGEFVSFAIVLLGTLTVVYPAYKLYREIVEYIHLKRMYAL